MRYSTLFCTHSRKFSTAIQRLPHQPRHPQTNRYTTLKDLLLGVIDKVTDQPLIDHQRALGVVQEFRSKITMQGLHSNEELLHVLGNKKLKELEDIPVMTALGILTKGSDDFAEIEKLVGQMQVEQRVVHLGGMAP